MKRQQMIGMLVAGVLLLFVIELSRVSAQFSTPATGSISRQTDAKTVATDVISKARIAHGGESNLRAVQSLSATGSFREALPGGVERTGDLELNFSLPDKYMRIESWTLGGDVRRVRMINSLDGEQAWFGSGEVGSDSTRIVVAGGGSADRETLAKLEQQAQQQLLESLRSESSRLLLAWLLSPSVAGSPLDFSYAGVAKAEDGEADVIDVRTTTGFAARVFFDKQTHRLLMLSYRGRAPRVLALKPGSSGDVNKALNTPDSELQLRFGDYRTVSDIQLPHRITHVAEGQAYREWQIKSFKLNPVLKPEKFRKKS